jgi:hypothetical protein
MKSLRFFLTFAFLLSALVSACGVEEALIREPEIQPEQTFSVDDVTVTVVNAQFRNSVQTYYLMHYPKPQYTYLELVLTIDGLAADPETVLAWGIENIALNCEDTDAALAFPRRVIADENIEYKVGEEINFNYVYIFSVQKDSDFETCRLVFSDGQRVSLSVQLEGSAPSDDSALTEEKGTVLSGENNQAYGKNAIVGGGAQNSANAIHATVSGGNLNLATTSHATVAGGRENAAIDFYATVGGGYANTASARDTFVGGGSRNTASGSRSTVAGGIQNQATAPDTGIAGGAYNRVTDDYAFVGGGTRNLATGYASVIGGGAGNTASADQATVSGGLGNQVEGNYGTVGGGYGNQVSGAYATVSGGFENRAEGEYSFAAGYRAVVSQAHAGAIVFADASDAKFHSEVANEFAVRATGGVRLVSAVTPEGEIISGVQLPAGSGSWATLSDRAAKTDFASIDQQEILATVIQLPILEWRYQGQAETIRHLGPVSQDFYAAFGLGDNERTISTVDADGVALAAIQGMYHLIQQQDTVIQDQHDRLGEIEVRLANLEQRSTHYQKSPTGFFAWLGWLLLVGMVCRRGWIWWYGYIVGLSRRKP